MRLTAALSGNLEKYMEEEIERGIAATFAAAKRVDGAMKSEVRGYVGRIYGPKIAKTWRSKIHGGGKSLSPAVVQFSKAPRQMANITDTGPIRSPAGLWLAIPTDVARRLLPARLLRSRKRNGVTESAVGKVEQRLGVRLQFVMPGGTGRGKRAYLIADGVRERKRKAKSGPARTLSKVRRLKSGDYGKGATSVVLFTLVPMVRRAGRLDLKAIEIKYSQRYAAWVAEEWNAGK